MVLRSYLYKQYEVKNGILNSEDITMDYSKYIGVTPDFPKKGISFKDISPLLRNPEAFSSCIDDLAKRAEPFNYDVIIGPESRAFLFGAALAYKTKKGFVMARKGGKLPGITNRLLTSSNMEQQPLKSPLIPSKMVTVSFSSMI